MLITCEKVGVDSPPFFFYTDDMNYKALLYALLNGFMPIIIGLGLGFLIVQLPTWVLSSIVVVCFLGYLYYLYRSYEKHENNYEK